MKDSLGDRIKGYESVTRNYAVRRMPLMIRVDGKAFHTFTKNFPRPYCDHLIKTMVHAAYMTAKQMQGFKAAYVQSDEATFLITDYDDINTEGWFRYNLQKMVSISAAYMTVYFKHYGCFEFECPVFDSRAFNIPREDVVNAFLWRAKDWERNSLQMFARAHFSHKELHKKGREDMHEMLHKIGKNWATDTEEQHRNGTFIIKEDEGYFIRTDILPTYQSIAEVLDPMIHV